MSTTPKLPNLSSAGHVALVLAGCGAKDGSEITESVSLLVALAQAGFRTTVFAPDRATAHTINHFTGQEEGEARSILAEAARIARGNVLPLLALKAADFDALVFAGGFGVAKNLCNFALLGAAGQDAALYSDVRQTMLPFFTAQKPLAALCIAPVVLALGAREAGLTGIRITLGDGTAKAPIEAVQAWGAVHVPTAVDAACLDPVHRLVTAPAYMYDSATPADIFASASALVSGLQTLLRVEHGGQAGRDGRGVHS